MTISRERTTWPQAFTDPVLYVESRLTCTRTKADFFTQTNPISAVWQKYVKQWYTKQMNLPLQRLTVDFIEPFGFVTEPASRFS
jgi:hypothetical protein